MFSIYNKVTRESLIMNGLMFFLRNIFCFSGCCCCCCYCFFLFFYLPINYLSLAISFFNFIFHLLTTCLSLMIILLILLLLLLLSLLLLLLLLVVVVVLLLLLLLLCWLILPLQLFLKNLVGESSKRGTQATWSTPIHHSKLWIRRFRDVSLSASEGELFFILLKGFRPWFNVTRSSVLVVVGVLCLPLHFIIIAILVIVIFVSNFIVIINFIVFIIIRIFIKNNLLFLWGELTAWFCSFQFLHLSSPDPYDRHLVLTHYLNVIIRHHLIMVIWRQRT